MKPNMLILPFPAGNLEVTFNRPPLQAEYEMIDTAIRVTFGTSADDRLTILDQGIVEFVRRRTPQDSDDNTHHSTCNHCGHLSPR